MKEETVKRALIVALAVGWSASAVAQDAVKADPKHYKVLTENANVRILKIAYGAGEKSPMHQHPDSVVIPLGPTKVRFTMPDGKTVDQELTNESAMFMEAGSHSPANMGAAFEAVLVEFKSPAAGTATLPTSRSGIQVTVLAEGARGMAYRATADSSFHEPAGSTHDYDQVVIALGPSQMSLSLDGKPARTKWARGDTVFIPRGTAHESKNAGQATDFIIVAIK
jgi:quercetin dioxygenase-like cupin family protein